MNSAVHLTEEQIDDYLIGDVAEGCETHLASCPECQARVAAMEAPINSFKDVSLAWSERQSATLPVRPIGIRQQPSLGHRAVWASTATALIAVGVVVPLTHRMGKTHAPTVSPASAQTQTFTAAREEQIAQDNQMLRAIDRELGAPVSSPAETFGLELSPAARRSAQNAPLRD